MIIQKHARPFENKSVFTFDKIFHENRTTAQVYHGLVRPLVNAAYLGRHGTVFCYGQTGAGKTYTMQGDDDCVQNTTGIIQMAAADLFDLIEEGSRECSVRVSFIEIYNERIRDLLSDCDELTVTDDQKSGNIVNAKTISVADADALQKLLHLGNKNRATAATKMNERSSRSHAIFRITVESREPANNPTNVEGNRCRIVRVSTLNLVDLAGSENGKLTKAIGNRQREGGMINQSLLSLSQVIQALSVPINQRPSFINYRDSKLTRVLQPHLSGNALMAILCCVSPSALYVEETRSTLRFASRAKLVQTKARINEIVDDTTMIQTLQKELVNTRNSLSGMEQREVKAERALLEAREELKKLKDMIFREFDLPEFEMTSRDVTPSPPRDRYGANGSIESTLTHGYGQRQYQKEPRSNFGQKSMCLAKGIIIEPLPEKSKSALNMDTGMFHRTKCRARPNHLENMMDIGISNAPPSEVVVIMSRPSSMTSEDHGFRDKSKEESEERARFLHGRLEVAEDLIDSLVHDVESARMCIRQLVVTNASVASKSQKLQRKVHLVESAKDDRHHSQYMLLKYCIYISLFFFLFGCQELFLACILFLWLSLEVVT